MSPSERQKKAYTKCKYPKFLVDGIKDSHFLEGLEQETLLTKNMKQNSSERTPPTDEKTSELNSDLPF